MSPFLKFLLLMLGIDLVGFIIAAGIPDPSIRLYIVGGTLLISPLISFYVVYGTEPDALMSAFGK